MNKVLKKQTLKVLMPYLIAAAVLAVIFIAIAAQGILCMLSGATPLSQSNLDDLNGEYVTFDASDVIVAFATLSVSSESSSEVRETYYLLPAGDGTYLAVMDAKEKNTSVLDRAMDQSHEYYLGDLETLTKLGALSGTVAPLEDDMTSYMVECITNYSLPGYDAENITGLIRPYQVNIDKVGFLYTGVATLLFAIGLGFLVVFLVLLVPALAGLYQKHANALVDCEDPEAAFSAAETIERIHVGAYIWYPKGASTKVLKTESIVWGYAMPEPLVVSKYRWPVALFDAQQNMTQICFMEKKNREAFLGAIASQGYPFVSGYTSELSQLFKSDPEGFVERVNGQTQS